MIMWYSDGLWPPQQPTAMSTVSVVVTTLSKTHCEDLVPSTHTVVITVINHYASWSLVSRASPLLPWVEVDVRSGMAPRLLGPITREGGSSLCMVLQW